LETRVPARLRRREGRRFGLTVGIAFAVLAGIFSWRGHLVPLWIAGTAALFLILSALLVPGRLGPVRRAWMGLATAISKVTTPIVMAAIYFLVLTPAGLLLRLLKGSPLERHHSDQSTWVTRDPDTRQRVDLHRQF
jgi:hypothetical protein